MNTILKSSLLVIFLSLMFYSCDELIDTDNGDTEATEDALIGTWELDEASILVVDFTSQLKPVFGEFELKERNECIFQGQDDNWNFTPVDKTMDLAKFFFTDVEMDGSNKFKCKYVFDSQTIDLVFKKI